MASVNTRLPYILCVSRFCKVFGENPWFLFLCKNSVMTDFSLVSVLELL